MKHILIIGAGKSATALINFLIEKAEAKDRMITVADTSLELARQKTKSNTHAKAVSLDINDEKERKSLIKQADIVISMLPAFLHPIVAGDCLTYEKHFFSASYESEEMRKMASSILDKNLLFLNECGLDPGLDHMSALKIIDEEKSKGHKIILFKSYTGGLLAPESDDNPWKYKFTWNPRNVVLAGQGVSRFIRNGKYKYIPYHMLFSRTEKITFEGLGDFDGYPNRDSLSYRKVYGLENIPTILRGTLRRAGFCRSWDVFVKLGLTDDSFKMDLPANFTMRMFLNSFLPYHENANVEDKLQELLPWIDGEIIEKIKWTGILENSPLPLFKGSPAEILQAILEIKWQLNPGDKDMIIMQHLFEIETASGTKRIVSSLITKGIDQENTAMARTVGLPLAVAVDLFMDGKIKIKGLQLPIHPEIYVPILACLEKEGVIFNEREEMID